MKKIYSLIALAMTTIGFAQNYELVTSQSDVEANSEYLIVGQRTNGTVWVMSKTQNTNNRAALQITGLTELPESIEYNDSYASLTLEATTESNQYAFLDADSNNSGYLYAASSGSNHLKTQVTNNSNGFWTITIGEENIASIVAQGTNTRNVMQMNTSSALFSCYGSDSQAPVYLYKLVEEETPVEPVAPTASFDLQEALTISPSLDDASSFFGNAVVTIANLGEGQTASLSLENTENFEIITPEVTDLGNGTHSIQIRFNAQGLAANTYTTNLNVEVASQTTALATLEIVGVVSPSLSNNLNTIEGLNIYPNPANDVVTITSAANGVKNVQLFDVTGKQIMNVETSSTINVSSLAKGIYIMKVTEAGKSATSKLVIK